MFSSAASAGTPAIVPFQYPCKSSPRRCAATCLEGMRMVKYACPIKASESIEKALAWGMG